MAIDRRGSLIYMLSEDIPSLVLGKLGISRKRIIQGRVYVFDKSEMTLRLCPEWFLEKCNAKK